MNIKKLCISFAVAMVVSFTAMADDFLGLTQSYPNFNIAGLEPVFDMDDDGCLPSAGYSQTGVKNGGNSPSGSLGGGCRHSSFLDYSNIYHRHTCKSSGGHLYCGHMYALYFKKDMIAAGGTCLVYIPWPVDICAVANGHRHDWEFVAVFTKDGVVTDGAASDHSSVLRKSANDIPKHNGHLKFVYHKSSSTHAMRFANSSEDPENPYDEWVTPPIVSWYYMSGTGVTNSQMRAKFNSDWTGDAKPHIRDNGDNTTTYFFDKLNEAKPDSYPSF